eukprot:GHUV01002084.1.p1 GENE.GHUV01002084.1~~GHUV01002084.1.p1  ORF type:complete len:775 (+),score=225.89 GHUV01002084.1:456-2780(+)
MSSQNKNGMVINAPGAKATPTNGQTTKKLVLKPLKLKPKLPANFEEDTWAKLQAAVKAVHNKQPVATSLEELYRAVEDMCRHQMQDRLYNRLQAECDAHIGQQMSALQSQTQMAPSAFLERVSATWDDYCSQMLLIRSIFLYLDRTYVMSLPGLRSLFDTGLVSLRKHLAEHSNVESHIMRGLLDLVDRERQGDAVDRQLLAGLVRMLGDLGLYSTTFSPKLLDETAAFYKAEGLRLMESTDVPHYLIHCESRIQQEQERCLHYLDPSSRRPLLHEVEQQLLAAHVKQILDKGFKSLMSGHRVQDLGRLYSLLGRVGGTDALREEWKRYIVTTGTAIVKDEANDKELVERFLDLKTQLDEILSISFQSAPTFSDQLTSAFQVAVNSRSNKPAELVAKFIDAKLRGSKGVNEGELEATLDKALVVFGYIQGKDVFEAFYKKDLAKRLLLGRSASMDAEKLMISKLKTGCGGNFTANIEGMFRDMDVASETMDLFRRQYARDNRLAEKQQQPGAAAPEPAGPAAHTSSSSSPGSGIDVHVTVLTQAHWPTQTLLELNLPSELVHWQTRFKDFYSKHYSTYRQLVWQHSLSTAMLRANFSKGTKELSVSLMQALVLLLFNDADELTFAEIKDQLGVKDERELQRTMLSLSVGKVRVLTKNRKGPEVSPSDVFAYNSAFSNPLFRIKINNIQLKETQEENTKTNEQVVQERQHAIDAAIVRIMKMRKQLSHKLLVQEVMTQLRFQLTNADLKRRIDNLIEREFLERSSTDSQTYNYLA